MEINIRVADHMGAVRDLAKATDMQEVWEEVGFVRFGSEDYDDGNGVSPRGTSVEVWFNECGEIVKAHRLYNGGPVESVDVTGNPGQRLLATLKLF